MGDVQEIQWLNRRLPSRGHHPEAAEAVRLGAPSREQVLAWMDQPFNDLLWQAQQIHRQHFDPNQVELATLLSIKTGGCPEDCGYCPQSIHHPTGLQATKMLGPQEVRHAVRLARQAGAQRFCMGAAWRAPKDRDIEKVVELIRVVKEEGLEACCTLGMLNADQAAHLKQAGLDYYNHNLDTAPEVYGDIVSTRDYQDRLDTLDVVRQQGMKVCTGGIVGLGESRAQRAGLIAQLAAMEPQPDSVPINDLVRVEGTPMSDLPALDPLEFVRTIAAARIALPRARVRLSAGRRQMSDAVQALCFLAGANSIFYGEKLLTTGNPDVGEDLSLLSRLGLQVRGSSASPNTDSNR